MFTALQILLLIVTNILFQIEQYAWITFYGNIVARAFIAGLIMGNIPDALFIGGTYELMNIGLNPIGGSSVPNYQLGATVGVAFAAVMGDVNGGMAVGIIVATLGTSLDVLWKMLNSFFLHKIQDAYGKANFKSADTWAIGSFWFGVLFYQIPLLLVLVAGSAVVQAVNEAIPQWLLNGFSNAGNLMPAIGFAVLLHSLPAKDYLPYIMVGWFLYAYVGVPVLGIAVLGAAIAMIYYKNSEQMGALALAEGDDDDE